VSLVARRALALFRVGYAYMTEYRAELILWALASSLSFILMGVWYEAAGRGSFALAPVDVVRYFLAVFVVRQLTVVWVIWEVEEQVQGGKLAPQLLQPLDPVWRHFMNHVAERVARLPFSAALIALFFVLYPQALWIPSPSTLALFVLLVATAFLLRFLVQYTIALLCFWTERASSLEQLNFLLYMFLGGAIAPLDFFPPAVRDVVLWTPFPAMVWLPCRVLLGDVPTVDVVRAVSVLLGWCVVFVVANRILWRAGLRRFSAMGA
jgi:ABC-2 type transport system permease protein